MSKDKKSESKKDSDKDKKKQQVCRYLWFNEYYASQQNRLQQERLQLHLKLLNKEKIQKLVKFHNDTQDVLDEQKRCITSTGKIRENYQSIVESRNNSAIDTFLQYNSVGRGNPNFNRHELQDKFQKNVIYHKFKKVENLPEKQQILKQICNDDDDDDDDDDDGYDGVREIDDDDESDDDNVFEKNANRLFHPRQSLSSNFKENKLMDLNKSNNSRKKSASKKRI